MKIRENATLQDVRHDCSSPTTKPVDTYKKVDGFVFSRPALMWLASIQSGGTVKRVRSSVHSHPAVLQRLHKNHVRVSSSAEWHTSDDNDLVSFVCFTCFENSVSNNFHNLFNSLERRR